MASDIKIKSLFKSTIFRKQIVGISGLAISGFVLLHMTGNCLMFLGPEAYNVYGHAITSVPTYLPIEIGLALTFLVHIIGAILVSLENRKATPCTAGAMKTGGEKQARFGSSTMIYTGLLVFVFLVLHLITFRFGTYYEATYNGLVVRDLHRLMVEMFNQPLYTGWYLLSMLVLGVHLSHGFSAVFQTLGIAAVNNAKVNRLGWIFAVVVAGGFIAQPLYAIWAGGR